MSNRQAVGIILVIGALFGCVLGEMTRRHDGNPLGLFDAFGWALLAVAFYVALGSD